MPSNLTIRRRRRWIEPLPGGAAAVAVVAVVAMMALIAPIPVRAAPKLTAAMVQTFCSAPAVVSATLTGVTPLNGQTITFQFSDVVPLTKATTDGNGQATATVNFNAAGTYPYTASWMDGSGTTLSSVAATTITSAATTLSPLTFTPVPRSASGLVIAGQQMVVTTVLSRTDSPGGPVNGATVTFTRSDSKRGTVTIQGTFGLGSMSSPLPPHVWLVTDSFDGGTSADVTRADGSATATFGVTDRGLYSVVASFGGSSTCLQAASSEPLSVDVYQQAKLSLSFSSPNVSSAICGAPASFSAALTTVVGDISLPYQTVVFTFGNNAAPRQTVIGNVNGVASATATFPFAASVAVTASFSNGQWSITAYSPAPHSRDCR